MLTNDRRKSRILIFGGAGFIGANLAHGLLKRGYQITVIDGLIEGTGGRANHLAGIQQQIEFFPRRLEDMDPDRLVDQLAKADSVLNCMVWTSHLDALAAPRRDYELNCHNLLMLL